MTGSAASLQSFFATLKPLTADVVANKAERSCCSALIRDAAEAKQRKENAVAKALAAESAKMQRFADHWYGNHNIMHVLNVFVHSPRAIQRMTVWQFDNPTHDSVTIQQCDNPAV
jgi:hypothetical protein